MTGRSWPCWTAPWPSLGPAAGQLSPLRRRRAHRRTPAARPGPPAGCVHQPASGGRDRLHLTAPHHRGRRRPPPHALRAGRCRLQPSLHRPPFRPDVLRRRRRLRKTANCSSCCWDRDAVRPCTGPAIWPPASPWDWPPARSGATSTISTAAPRSPASKFPTGWSRIRSFWRSATPCWSNSANWVWAIRWPSPRPTSRPSSPATTGRSPAA